MQIADVESPYNGPDTATIKRNILYARIACRWALENGFFPYASHLFFTQPGILDDEVPEERDLGINAGKEIIRESANVSLFFLDMGESTGMKYGRLAAEEAGRPVREIRLFDRDMGYSTFSELLEEAYTAGLLSRTYHRKGWS